MRHPIDYIFIDTSLFVGSSFFKENGVIERFFDQAEKGYVKIIMPAITEKEWHLHFEENARVKFDITEKPIRVMGKKRSQEFLDKYSTLSKDYEDLIREVFKSNMERANLEKLPIDYPNDQLKKIFDKYFSKEKPFGTNGKKSEFPDAFVLASLEKYAKSKGIKILVFAKDKDFIEYASDCLELKDPNTYLNELVTKRIPEAEKRERISADISRLYKYIDSKPRHLLQQIQEEVTRFLSDYTSYIDLLDYADIEEISIDNLNLDISAKDMEIHSVDEDDIEVLCFVDIDVKVRVKYFDEDESIWDSEEKDYLFKSYSTMDLDLSSVLPVTFLFPRLEDGDEFDEWNNLDVEVILVDSINLQEVIDNYRTYNETFGDIQNEDLPKLVKDMTELKDKVNLMTNLLNKKSK